ncbi:cob(I)yrinic acid a,c-diamide adenosyltransferase [Thiohalophilus sp.]|uniref:cob(I)yrinic acid a,c-diamide adenosyltransferase n=1 Tax=Thiohalophilus sp. TaxID=3028392 RepID=UPI002ACED1B8|nr:cob(I)yrinic acid a,c-diamide adenosyltransferase [Thiohalophilus sp.]MDZ7663650.1 cob(I)yrinic acid a,c-diamide adenosyltransferase [Thiohalophilus sp.]
MGHRLSKIYTRTGDQGETGLGDGSRVSKTHPRVETFGTVDELNSLIGMILAHELPQAVRDCLVAIQHDLFDLGGELSVPGYEAVDASYAERLETELDKFNDTLPALKEFILPAGGIATSTCHLARAVCRRAERDAVALAASEAINPAGLIYLNRLSDLLFVVARVLARFENGEEVLWQPGKNR